MLLLQLKKSGAMVFSRHSPGNGTFGFRVGAAQPSCLGYVLRCTYI